MSDWMNDFELAVGAVFDDDASRQVIQDFLRFAGRMDKAAADSYRAQGRAQGEFHKGALKDQQNFGRKFTDAEKQQARALLVVTREYLRERARAERAAADDHRREFERQEKKRLADEKAANQRTQAIIAAGIKDAEARRRSAAKIREQDNASGLRRFENQEKQSARALERIARESAATQAAAKREAARNLERLAKEQAAEQVRVAKEQARNLERLAKEQAATAKAQAAATNAAQARADRDRVARSTQAAKEEAAVARREGERLAQQQKQQDRILFNSEQESSARRIARAKAFYSTLSTIARAGAQATQNVVTSFFRRRENAAKASGDRITNIDRSTTTKSTSVIRQQLDAQNREYTRAAQRRLAIIDANADRERGVITANAVKTAEAQAAIQQRTSTGLVGAATGRSVTGGGLRSLLIGSAGLYGIKKLIDASSSLAESQSKVDVVFGASADTIRRFAADSAKAIGESEQATLEALGTYGNLFQSFGVGRKLATDYSIGLVKLASDLASFNNTSVQDAIEALRSGLTGETEPLKRYGIAINETLLKQEAARLGLVRANVSQTQLTKNQIAAEKAQLRVSAAIKKYGADSLEAREATAALERTTEAIGKTLKGKLPAQLDSAQKAQAAYSLIMQRSSLAQGDFNRTQEGFANQSRIVTARLKDLQAAAGNGLLPIALALAAVFNKAILPALEGATEAVSGFIRNIATGSGVWKIARDGLIGLSVGLGALLAVKAGVEVIGLLGAGLKVLGGAIVAAPVLAALVGLGAVGYTLYRNAPGVRSFFDSLVEGTKNWYLVGYRISEPIKNLSTLVLLQSSFGAAARVIVDGFQSIGRGVEDFRAGLGTGALEEAMRQTLRGLGDTLTPARDVVADGLRTIFERGRDFLTLRALPILGEARLSIGSFLLPLLGLTGGDGGVVSRFLTTAITKLFLGSITAFNPNLPAAQLGLKGREIIDGAIEYARGAAANVQAFFGSLFGGDVDFESFASELGGQLNASISGAFSRLKERVGPVNDLLAAIGGAVAAGFTSFVLPKLIELPRIVGRAISRTVFSEEFLKAITIGAAAIAGGAVLIAGQFVRGFIEGLISRRGDIAKTVIDILKFTVDTVLGTGNPFIIFGGLLVAAFAGAKVLGGIGTLRNQFRIAAAGMTGDALKLQRAIENATATKAPVSNSAIGNATFAVGDFRKKFREFTVGSENAFRIAARHANGYGEKLDEVSNKALKLPEGTRTMGTAWVDSFGKFTKGPAKDLKVWRSDLGRTAGIAADMARRVGVSLNSIGDYTEKVGTKARAVGDVLRSKIPEGASKAQLGVEAATGAMAGYFTGLAETTEARAVGALTAIGTIASSYAQGGPIFAAVTATATAIGWVWGESTRGAREAKEAQKKAAEEMAASAMEIRDAYSEAFKEIGSTGAAARGVATLRVIESQLKGNSQGVEDFTRKFGGSWAGVTEAARRGNAELKLYTDELISRKIRDIFTGNADAIRTFSAEVDAANRAALRAGEDVIVSGRIGVDGEQIQFTNEQIGAIERLNDRLRSGSITWETYTKKLNDAGVAWDDIAVLTKAYTDALTEGLGSSAGGKIISSLATEMGKAVREQDLMEAAQQRVNRELASTASVAERFAGAWGRVKEGIDRAVQAFQSWIDATTGRQQTRNESITSILGAARSATGPAGEGVSSLERTAEIENSAIEQARNAGAQLEQIWRDAGGNVETFNANARAYFDDLREAAPTKEAQDFISQVQYLASSPQAIDIIVNSTPAVKSLEEIQTRLTDAISLPGGEAYAIDLSTTEGTKRAETLGSKLAELYNTDATVKAYIDSEFPGGFAEAYTQIIADTGFLEQITATAKADLDPSGFDEKKRLITSGLDELERRETTLRVTPKLYDPTGGWTKLFGFLGIDLALTGSSRSSVGAAPPGFNNTERERWGGVTAYASGGITQAHVQRGQRIKYAEPETGGEAYVPRRGVKARSEAITHQIASWLGGRFIPSSDLGKGSMAFASGGVMGFGPDEGRTDTYVRNNRDGSIDVLESRTNKVLEHFSAAVVKLNKIMASVSKAMTAAEARAAVLGATAAQKEIGPGALARWNEALTRFFSGGSASTTDKRNDGSVRVTKGRTGRSGPDEGRTDTHTRTNFDGSVDVLEDRTNRLIQRIPASAMGGGARFSRGPDEGRTDTSVRNNWDGSIDVLEAETGKVLEHYTAAVVKLNKVMASVSAAMSAAEARAAVMAATAAQKEIGPGAYARWMEALTRFFSGGASQATIKGTESISGLPKPSRPLPAPTRAPTSNRSDTDFSKPQVVVNRNLTVNNKITATAPRPTALEVARSARSGDFLAGGPAIEMEFAS